MSLFKKMYQVLDLHYSLDLTRTLKWFSKTQTSFVQQDLKMKENKVQTKHIDQKSSAFVCRSGIVYFFLFNSITVNLLQII